MLSCFVYIASDLHRPLAFFLSLIPIPHPLSPSFSSDCGLTSAMAVSQPFAHQSLPHSFPRDGGYTPLLRFWNTFPTFRRSNVKTCRRSASPKSFCFISFADPHPLNLLESYRFRNSGEGWAGSRISLSLLAATLMGRLVSAANAGLTERLSPC